MERDATPGPGPGVRIVRGPEGPQLVADIPAGWGGREEEFGRDFQGWMDDMARGAGESPSGPEGKWDPRGAEREQKAKRIAQLLGAGGDFLDLTKKPTGTGFEFFRPFDTTELVPASGEGGDGVMGGVVQPLPRSDETLVKMVASFKYQHGTDDFAVHCREIVGLATAVRATRHLTNMSIYMSIEQPARSIVADLMPSNKAIVDMSTEDYIDSLSLRLCDVTETKIAQKIYKVMTQKKGEGAATYFYRKVAAYKRAYPAEQRDFFDFSENFIKGLKNEHLCYYLTWQLSEMKGESDIHHCISKGILFVYRQIETGKLPKAEGYGLRDSKLPRDGKQEGAVNVLKEDSDGEGGVVGTVIRTPAPKMASGKASDKCFYCEAPGHYAKDCFKKKKDLKAGTYKFRPAKVEQIAGSTSESSEEADSETEAVINLIENGQMDPKKGRKVVRKLARAKKRKPKERVNEVEDLAQGGDQEDLNELQVQVNELRLRMDDHFLGKISEGGKRDPSALKSKQKR